MTNEIEKLTKEALIAAVAFINSHVADPDINPEMVKNYEEYKKAMRELNKVRTKQNSTPPPGR